MVKSVLSCRSSGSGSGLKLVAELPFSGGTHMETASIGGWEYAFVSEIESITGSLRVVDITTPVKPRVVATLPCNGNQGNVQLSHDKKTLGPYVYVVDSNLGFQVYRLNASAGLR